MKIRQKDDGFFDIHMEHGRVITGLYGRLPVETQPSHLTLFTLVNDPEGMPFGIVNEYEVSGALDKPELRRLCEDIEKRARAKERGEATSNDVVNIDLRTQ
jgi:hypothetical protein